MQVYELRINPKLNDDAEVEYVALVDEPAIEKDFIAFKSEFINPKKGEHKTDFIPRCVKYVIGEGKSSDQAVAICNSIWTEHFASDKISLDYDGVLSTRQGKDFAKSMIAEGNAVYIISARNDKEGMMETASELGIPADRVFATGSNKEKVAKVISLGIDRHYDNNPDVISALPQIGHKFNYEQFAESYTDYPKAASENAKIALRWVEENGWGDCGTAVGKVRANQLANNEPISRDTIARMAAFERHRQNSQKELGDGCGRLMWLAWGGDEGIEWASRKLKEIDNQKFNFQIVSEDQHIISGPLMLADKLIYRNNDTFGEHYVKFSADTIKQIAIKFAKKGYQKNVNLMHDPEQKVSNVTMFESFITDSKRGIKPMAGFEDAADGSWFGSFYVEDEGIWNRIKAGEFKGFSVEGLFAYTEPISEEMNKINELKNILNDIENDEDAFSRIKHLLNS